MHRILIVEDEEDIADLVAFNLQRQGHEAFKALDGITGIEMALEHQPDLVILDLMLPGRDGYEVLKELRKDSRTRNTPVLMLTARSQVEDRIRGLEAGADDYLTKPFSSKELMLRVQSILKRAHSSPGAVTFKHGPFHFDKNAQQCFVDNEPVDLTSTEFKLMVYLCERAGTPQDRHVLLSDIWGYSDTAQSRTLDTHMKRLRQKLGEHGSWVETVRGIGYRVPKPD